MEFDITDLDKVLLIKTLYAHAVPNGMGKAEYFVRQVRGENIIGLSDEECEEILSKDDPDALEQLIDYHKGKPIKLSFDHRSNGKIFACSDGYDSRNGRYRFLEALLNVFDLDEIIFIKKGYPRHLKEMIDECTHRSTNETLLLKNVVLNTTKQTDVSTYWIIDTDKVDYRPPFMRDIN